MTGKITASRVAPGDVIRKYAPYTYWLDWQRVVSVVKRGGWVTITRADGDTRGWAASTRFEIQASSCGYGAAVRPPPG